MISSIKNVSTLIAMLKQYGIQDVVLAPGGSDIPIIHMIETDSYFTCYSVVDERSLVYFAMGISQQKKAPVACVCTSGTAVSNFLPGMTEAFYRDVPIIAITADKNQNFQGQLETQKINQIGIFGECCRKSINLPVIRNNEDQWLCERLINEALIELHHHGSGPVQINIPVEGDISSYVDGELPKCKKITLIEGTDNELFSHYIKQRLSKFEKIMILVGQDIDFSDREVACIEKFAYNYNVVIAADHQANLNCFGTINTYPITEMEKKIDNKLIPSLVISLGNNIASYDLKYILRRANNVEHWQIDEAGRIRDVFHHLTTVFECNIFEFFSAIEKNQVKKARNDYYEAWKEGLQSIIIDEIPYSSFYIAKELSKAIPENSILHLAILNSTRLMQYFPLQKGVKTYSNLGALGIDGCLSSFMGQAVSTDQLAFCLIGDLSFFYDMNAVSICHRKNNIRIILLNNSGAGEFYFTLGKETISSIDKHIGAINRRTAKGWVESLGYKYYSVHNSEEAHKVISNLGKRTDFPVFVEVFTDIEEDTGITRSAYKKNLIKTSKDTMKDVIKGTLGDKGFETVKTIYHRIKRGES